MTTEHTDAGARLAEIRKRMLANTDDHPWQYVWPNEIEWLITELTASLEREKAAIENVARLREEIEHIIGNIEGELAIKKPLLNDTFWPNPIVYGRALERWEMSEDIRRVIGMMREHAADVLRTEGEG